MITHNFQYDTRWHSLLSDERNFYLTGYHEIAIINSTEFRIEKVDSFSYRSNGGEVDIVGNRLFLNGYEFKDGQKIPGDRPRLLLQPHLYKGGCYRTKNYFIALLPLMSREPKLFLPPHVLEEGIDSKRGILVYHLGNGQYKFLGGRGSHIAMTLDESMIGIVHSVFPTSTAQNVEFKIFDNPLA